MVVRSVARPILFPAQILYTIHTGILTDRSLQRRSTPEAQEEFKNNLDVRLSPESIAEVWHSDQTRINRWY